MKLKHIIPAGLMMLMALGACKKIEIKPTGQVSPEEAINDQNDLLANLNATYTPLRGDGFWGGRTQIVGELMADVVDGTDLTGDYLSVYRLNTTATNGTSDDLYNEPYVIIYRANVTLEKLALISDDATRKNVEGQARFMRGFAAFENVKLFSQPYGYTQNNSHPGMVIKTISEAEKQRSRNTVMETYTQLIEDLKAAATLLPPTNGNYPTSWAAKAILARVYFQMNDFANAYAYANEVITQGPFTFDNSPNFVTNRFSVPHTTEAIWWLVNEPNLGASFGPLRNQGENSFRSLGLPITRSAFLAGTANPSDLRRAWYKDTLTATGATVYSIVKYRKTIFELPIIHLTELKFIRAESAAELNQNLAVAIADINDITNRAYGGALAPLPGNATPATIIARVRAERKLEMVFESGDRLQQIKRIGAKGEASTLGQASWNCPGFVLQIPSNEILVNPNFEQNPQGGCSR